MGQYQRGGRGLQRSNRDATGKAHALGDQYRTQVREAQEWQGLLGEALLEGHRIPKKPPRARRGEAKGGLPLAS